MGSAGHGRQVHLVTQARKPMSEDIAFRQRRYLIMMGIRAVCFVVAVVMFVNHLGWLSAFPIVLAILIPYFAVVFANGGREPNNVRGFMEYQPRLPANRDPHDADQGNHDGTPGSSAPPNQNGS
jgi:hypothetical protein